MKWIFFIFFPKERSFIGYTELDETDTTQPSGRMGHAIKIQSVDFTNGIVYVQNVGEGTVRIISVSINGMLVTISEPVTPYSLIEDKTKGLTIFEIKGLTSGTERRIKVMCEDGTFTEGTYTVS